MDFIDSSWMGGLGHEGVVLHGLCSLPYVLVIALLEIVPTSVNLMSLFGPSLELDPNPVCRSSTFASSPTIQKHKL